MIRFAREVTGGVVRTQPRLIRVFLVCRIGPKSIRRSRVAAFRIRSREGASFLIPLMECVAVSPLYVLGKLKHGTQGEAAPAWIRRVKIASRGRMKEDGAHRVAVRFV